MTEEEESVMLSFLVKKDEYVSLLVSFSFMMSLSPPTGGANMMSVATNAAVNATRKRTT